MALETPRLKLVKPDTSELADINVLNNNFDKIDAAPGVTICTSSTRPAAPFLGQQIYETDFNAYATWNGNRWIYQPGSIFIHVGKTNGFQSIANTNPGAMATLGTPQIKRGPISYSGSIITITEAGVYRVTAGHYFTGGAAYAAEGYVMLNGNASNGKFVRFSTWKSDAKDYFGSTTSMMNLNANDNLQLWAITPNSVWGSSGYNGCYLEVEYLGIE